MYSDRTKKYVEALSREGKDFDYKKWLRQVQEVVMSLQFFFPVLEPLATKCCLIQLPLLDHGPHSPIKDYDTFLE